MEIHFRYDNCLGFQHSFNSLSTLIQKQILELCIYDNISELVLRILQKPFKLMSGYKINEIIIRSIFNYIILNIIFYNLCKFPSSNKVKL